MNRNNPSRKSENDHRETFTGAEKLGFSDETTSDARNSREEVTTIEGHNTDNAIASGFIDKLEQNQYGTSWKEATKVIEEGANMASYNEDDRKQISEAIITTFQQMDFESDGHRSELARLLSHSVMEPIYDARIAQSATAQNPAAAENYGGLPAMNPEEVQMHHTDQLAAAIMEGNDSYAGRLIDQAIDWNRTEFWKDKQLTFATINDFSEHPHLQDHLITRCNEENWNKTMNFSGRSGESGYNEASIYAAAYTRELLLDAIDKRDNARFEEVMEFITTEGLTPDEAANHAPETDFPPIESHEDIEKEIEFVTGFIQKVESGAEKVHHHVLEIINRARNDLINDRNTLAEYSDITAAMTDIGTGDGSSPWDRALNQAKDMHAETFQEATFTAKAIHFLAGQ